MLLVFAGLVMLLTIASAGPLDESGCKKLGLVEEFDSFVQVRLCLSSDITFDINISDSACLSNRRTLTRTKPCL
jgi:hypothetical protein